MQWKCNDFKGKQCGGMDSPSFSYIDEALSSVGYTTMRQNMSKLNAFTKKQTKNKNKWMDGIIKAVF